MKPVYKLLLFLALPLLSMIAFLLRRYAMVENVLPILSVITAIYSAIVITYFVVINRGRWEEWDRMKGRLKLLELSARQSAQQQLELQTKVDFLSAEREIALVLNENVAFRTILEKVLEITADLFGGKGREEIAIYFRDSEHGNGAPKHLVPRAIRKNGKTFFDSEAETILAQDPLVYAVLEHARSIYTADEDRLNIIVPLAADRELLGVLKIALSLDGDREERTDRMNRLTPHIEEFAKFIALAVKTPDLYTRAVEDGLTKLATKRHFLTQLTTYFDSAKRYSEPLSLIMLDIDHFKKINDTYGHLAGDAVLKTVADVIRKNIRHTGDTAYSGYRYGGEELTVILPKAPLAKAMDVAERLRRAVEEKKITTLDGDHIKVTISLGIAEMNGDIPDPQQLIARADEALYKAKESGRNKVCTVN